MFTYQAGPWTAPLSIFDLFNSALFLIVIGLLVSSKKTKELKAGNSHYKYYTLNLYFKLFFALVYGAIYMFHYKGGDTMAYWQGAEKLNNLFWYSPIDYWTEMITPTIGENVILRFNPATGYPPMWIYKDPGSFFVSKIFSVLMLFLGQSYVLLSLFLGFVSAKASWKIYELIRYYNLTSDWLGALSVLFIPSVAFWCAGVSKDTIVLLCVSYLLYFLFGIANSTLRSKWKSYLTILILSYFLYKTRTFMLVTVLGPMLIAISTRIIKNYGESKFLKNILRITIAGIAGVGFLLFLRSQGDAFAKTTDQYINEASVQQTDFTNNKTYGEKRYDLGITDYSPFGMIKKAPAAIFTAFYRPGIWEARSPLLLISGIETSLFIYLTLYFLFKGKLTAKIRIIRQNEFLIFCLFFSFILAFFAGFTSVLFGVLVRFKAPLLPFFLILLTTYPSRNDNKENYIKN